jgi:hypothetical protein
MVNSFLAPSSVHLFGQKVTDFTLNRPVRAQNIKEVRLSKDTEHTLAAVVGNDFDGKKPLPGDHVLLMDQTTDPTENGRYLVGDNKKLIAPREYNENHHYKVLEGDVRASKVFKGNNVTPTQFDPSTPNIASTTTGNNLHLFEQVDFEDDDDVKPNFARIYGFSFDGYYHELMRPTNFLVHGDGHPVTDDAFIGVPARSPRDPSQTGVGAADFQIAGRMRVWVYDRADLTIRMDLDGGRFEDILLGFEIGDDFDPDGGGSVGGGRVGGGRVGGGRVGGGRVGGGRVGGGRVGGGRVGGGRVGGGRVGGG